MLWKIRTFPLSLSFCGSPAITLWHILAWLYYMKTLPFWLRQTFWRELSGMIRAKALWATLLLVEQTTNYIADNICVNENTLECCTHSLLLLNSIEKTVSSLVSVWDQSQKNIRTSFSSVLTLKQPSQVSTSGVFLSKKGLCLNSLSTAFLEPHYSILHREFAICYCKKPSSVQLKCVMVYCF